MGKESKFENIYRISDMNSIYKHSLKFKELIELSVKGIEASTNEKNAHSSKYSKRF